MCYNLPKKWVTINNENDNQCTPSYLIPFVYTIPTPLTLPGDDSTYICIHSHSRLHDRTYVIGYIICFICLFEKANNSVSSVICWASWVYGISLEYPSMQPWITSFQRISLWFPSIQTWFGCGTYYTLLLTVWSTTVFFNDRHDVY